VQAIVSCDVATVARMLQVSPHLAKERAYRGVEKRHNGVTLRLFGFQNNYESNTEDGKIAGSRGELGRRIGPAHNWIVLVGPRLVVCGA
jgi:hypothetical protein